LTAKTAVLTSSGWDENNSQTVTVNGVTSTSIIIVAPDPSNIDEYSSCGIYCSSQGTGTLSFIASDVPDENLTINILIG